MTLNRRPEHIVLAEVEFTFINYFVSWEMKGVQTQNICCPLYAQKIYEKSLFIRESLLKNREGTAVLL